MPTAASATRPPPRALINAVVALRRALIQLADRLVPAEVALIERATAVPLAMSLRAVADLHIADLLARGPQTAEQLAREAGADPDRLHRVLRYLAGVGIFDLDSEGRFRHNRLSVPLRTDVPGSAASFPAFATLRSMMHAWADFTRTVRTGVSSFDHVHGRSIWAHFEDHPDEAADFDRGMSEITRQAAPLIAQSYPFGEIRRLCDVAGGRGLMLATVLARHPQLEGVLFDRAQVLEAAPALLDAHGVRGRVTLAPGSFFERVPEGCDACMVKDILHDWDDARSVEILSTCRRALAPGARMLIVEILVERNDTDPYGALVDVMMMTVCSEGRQRSVAELQALLTRSGFRPGRVIRTLNHGIVEGIAE